MSLRLEQQSVQRICILQSDVLKENGFQVLAVRRSEAEFSSSRSPRLWVPNRAPCRYHRSENENSVYNLSVYQFQNLGHGIRGFME